MPTYSILGAKTVTYKFSFKIDADNYEEARYQGQDRIDEIVIKADVQTHLPVVVSEHIQIYSIALKVAF
mgnify:CR=1 FL=1